DPMQVYDIGIDKENRETTRHGAYDFPIAAYRTQLSKNVLGYVNWHWHEELQFMVVLEGSIQVSVNRSRIILNKGEGLFINGNVLHTIRPEKDPESTYLCLDVHPSLIGGYPGSRIDKKYLRPYLNDPKFTACRLDPAYENEQEIIRLLLKIGEDYTKRTGSYELSIETALLRVWERLIRNQPGAAAFTEPLTDSDSERLKALMTEIHNHYQEKICLKNLADAVHLSDSECCRFFKSQMNCTIFEYLNTFRIEKSIEDLLHTEKAVSRIAYDCGFGSTSYYIERFRKKTGITPGKYRKRAIDLPVSD
ncbi:MAG: AraC family transcriptional regulator, partial [Eubacteriaceae bacterium]